MTRQGEKVALQARARKTRDKLLVALEALLKERAFEDISVTAIAERAGVSVGAVYRRFENKDAFIPIVLDIYRARIEAFAAAPENRFEPAPDAGLFAAIQRISQLAWQFLKQDGHLLRAAFIYARTRPDLVGAEWDRFLEESAAGYRRLLSLFANEIARRDLDEAARMTLYLLNTGISEYGLYPKQGPGSVLKVTPGQFIDAIARAIFGYLTVPESISQA